jgi:tRNA (guanine-N7-)-methyltransferase
LAKRKLERFAENATFTHFFQPSWEDLQEGFPLRGHWLSEYFRNQFPISVEVGCGKGEYTVGLAVKYPERNFIGIDKKGARMWRGAKTTKESSLSNVAFIRMKAENIVDVFEAEEVDEIWITFPEPQPNSPKAKKRFTSPQFIDRYRKILKPAGIIHLKTDDDFLFKYTLNVIQEFDHKLMFATEDLYLNAADPLVKDVVPVQTHYEKIWLEKGLKIKYLRFQLASS